MTEVLLINSVIASERRREIEEERHRNGRTEPYTNYLAAPQSRLTGKATPDTTSNVLAGDGMLTNLSACYEMPT